MPEYKWFYQDNGKQIGPVSGVVLKSLVESGKVTGATPILREGKQSWVPASQVKGLIPAGPSTEKSASHSSPLISLPAVILAAILGGLLLSAVLFLVWVVIDDSRIRALASLKSEMAESREQAESLQEKITTEIKANQDLREELAQLAEARDRIEGEVRVLTANTELMTQKHAEQVLQIRQEAATAIQASKAANNGDEDKFRTVFDASGLQLPWSIVDPALVGPNGKKLTETRRNAYRQLLDGNEDLGSLILLDYDNLEVANTVFAVIATSFVFRERENEENAKLLAGLGDKRSVAGGQGLYCLIWRRGNTVVFMKVKQPLPSEISVTDPLFRLAQRIDDRLKRHAAE